MSHSDKVFPQLVEIAASLGALQRRFLAAMANGAQVLQVYPRQGFSAWQERESDGKIVQVCTGLSQNDFRAMRLLLPMISKASNPSWGTDFYYVPAASRALAKDALTLTQAVPEELMFRLEWERRQAEESASLEASGDGFVRERMAA